MFTIDDFRQLLRARPMQYALFALVFVISFPLLADSPTPATIVTFNKNFEGGAYGKIEKLGDAHFRIYVEGQQDARGRNRLANWYFFRMDGAKGRDVTLVLTDFVGEYNDRPGSCAMNADTVPVFSNDGVNWQHFPAMAWDNTKKEATLRFRPERDQFWLAHVPPYTPDRLAKLLGEIKQAPHAILEVIGQSVQGRNLDMVTVTNPEIADAKKKHIGLIARQHAWEAGTSYVMEGALRFIIGDNAQAQALRNQARFTFFPIMDPDGCANGKQRFNANGYDVNRHWDEVDLRKKMFLERMPEIWYVKKAIVACGQRGSHFDLLLNMHNTETAEYLDTQAADEPIRGRMERLFERLVAHTSFDPSSQQMRFSQQPGNTTNSLYKERKIPTVLMEQRISFSKKLGRRPTVADRLAFGKQLIAVMAETVSGETQK